MTCQACAEEAGWALRTVGGRDTHWLLADLMMVPNVSLGAGIVSMPQIVDIFEAPGDQEAEM